MTDYLFDKAGDDPEVRGLEELLGGYAHRAALREPPSRRRRRWPAALAVATLGALAIAALVVWRRGEPPAAGCPIAGPGFAFAISGGPARCGGAVAARGSLPVGAWLETSGAAVADVRVAEIGQLTLYGDSRVRLIGTGATGHRLELARGKLAARVVAPPRLFIVDTPGATAVDLGCAYELAVERDGRTRLRVTSGAVSLEGHGRAAYAPIDTEVIAVPGRGPGTPVALAAPGELRAAVARFDGGDRAALAAILAGAQPGDSITLWNLLSRTERGDRAAVFARLDELTPRPSSVDADAVLAGDPAAIDGWRQALDATWSCAGCGAPTKGKR